MRLSRSLSVTATLIGLLLAATAVPAAQTSLVMSTVSTAPDRVSGGDVLVRIDVPPGVPLSNVSVTLDRRDLTGMFSAAATGHALIGLVNGLQIGDNALRAGIRPLNPTCSS